MIHHFWLLIFDGNHWISYASFSNLEAAQASKIEIKRKFPEYQVKLTLILEEN